MIPKECKCKYCGARILWITSPEGRRIPIESRWTPYKDRRFDGSTTAPALWLPDGARIPCTPLPEDRADEAEGYAHMGHVCPAGYRPRKKRPLTRREMYREEWK